MNAVATRSGCLAVAGLAAVGLSTATADATLAAVVLVGGLGAPSRGMRGLVGWIVGGALVGGALGYGAATLVQLPLSAAGSLGLGLALGGGLGGISHLLSTEDPASVDDERMTVDMATESNAPEPRPADLFDEHPDPVLFVTDAGGGPVVRAANDAYEQTFGLPAATLEDTPLADVLRSVDDADGIAASLGAGDPVDDVATFDTPAGTQSFHVRSVGATGDGYLLFTPLEH